MLFWSNFLIICLFISLLTFNLYLNNLLSTILTVEFIMILIFFVYILNSLLLNLNWIIGFSFLIVILGGLEVALAFLLLNL